MKGKSTTKALVLKLLVLGFSVPALAHHSAAIFDTSKVISITGVVTEVEWTNPHSLLFLDARPTDQPNEKVVNWSVLLPAPAALMRIGWHKDSIKVGDTVTFRGGVRRDGRPQLSFVEVTDASGHHYTSTKAEY